MAILITLTNQNGETTVFPSYNTKSLGSQRIFRAAIEATDRFRSRSAEARSFRRQEMLKNLEEPSDIPQIRSRRDALLSCKLDGIAKKMMAPQEKKPGCSLIFTFSKKDIQADHLDAVSCRQLTPAKHNRCFLL